jgi:hypothetical protein
MKKLILFLFLSFFASISSVFAQNSQISLQAGFPLLMGFDTPNQGIYASIHETQGLNPSFAMEEKVATTYGKFRQNDDFFGHNGGHLSLSTAALGIRWNMRKEAIDFNPSLSLFPLGIGYLNNMEYNKAGELITPDNRFIYAPSAALNVQIMKHYNIGIELEAAGLIGSFYAGYSF